MRSVISRVVSILLLALAFTLSGCGGKEAVTFNDQIVRSLQRLHTAGQNFGMTIAPIIQQQNSDLSELRRTHKEAVDALTSIKTEIPTWKIPTKDSAQKLFQSFRAVMTIEEEVIGYFGDIVKIAEDPKFSNDLKAQRIEQTIRKFEDREKAAILDLQSKQQIFAKDHNIKLIAK